MVILSQWIIRWLNGIKRRFRKIVSSEFAALKLVHRHRLHFVCVVEFMYVDMWNEPATLDFRRCSALCSGCKLQSY